MRIFTAVGFLLTGFFAFTMLAGCSGNGSQVSMTPLEQGSGDLRISSFRGARGVRDSGPQVRASSFMETESVGKPLVFVSLQFNDVDIYLQSMGHRMVGQIVFPGNATGLATDEARNLYVANQSLPSPSVVSVYAPPYTKAPLLTLLDGSNSIFSVAVSRQGVVAIANACAETSSGGCVPNSGSITLYAQNSATPCATVADSTNFPYINYDSFDARGNLYLLAATSSDAVVGEIAGGCAAKKINVLTTGNTLHAASASGIHLTRAGRIAIADLDSNGRATIYTYDTPKKGSLGDPVSTTPLDGTIFVNDFAFQKSGRGVYAAAFSSSQDYVGDYDYPAGGPPQNTIDSGFANDVVVSPPLVP